MLLIGSIYLYGQKYQKAQLHLQAQKECCPTKYLTLAKTKKVKGNPLTGIKLFEKTDLNTKCYKELRLFVHVMNDSYKKHPFSTKAFMMINAYHSIGKGSWVYYTENFPKKYTSEFHGFSQIPVMGEKTRIVVYGYFMPSVKLKVDIAAYLVK
jgi:hypothetical protein